MPEEFQPGGRAPAPPPLRLVQDFVNTEIPEWHRDDVGSPEGLAAWLREHRLSGAGDEVDADLFVAARELRSALRELALANTLGTPLPPERHEAVDATLRSFPLAVRLVDGMPPAPFGPDFDLVFTQRITEGGPCCRGHFMMAAGPASARL